MVLLVVGHNMGFPSWFVGCRIPDDDLKEHRRHLNAISNRIINPITEYRASEDPYFSMLLLKISDSVLNLEAHSP
jgi:hypothetical protein